MSTCPIRFVTMRHTAKFLLFCLAISTNILAQEPFWQPTNGPNAADLRALAINVSGHIFAASYGGGIFRSMDNGNSWIAVNSGLTNTNVRALAINSTSGYIFAGTGGGGIFRSMDNGASWTAQNNGLTNTDVYALAINPSGHIFAGANRQIFRSSDNGASWTNVFNGFTNVVALAINSNGHIFAGTSNQVFRSSDNGTSWTNVFNIGFNSVVALAINSSGHIFSGTDGGGVYRSTNNGNNWTPVNSGLTNLMVVALAINPSGYIFAGTNGGGVYRSTNDGNNWTPVNSGLTDFKVGALAINSSGYIFAGTFGGFVFKSVQSTAPNRLPVVADAIPNQTLTIGGPSFTRDLNAAPVVFTDPDGDALTYTTSSSATNIATASISGATLTVAPMAASSATITVTANDGRGGTASTTFTVTVGNISNRPPVVANVISNQLLTVGGAAFTRDLNASPTVFTEPDGDPLGYTANSNASSIATASISASTLTIAPVAVGNATITVTANDNRGGTVSTTFTVTVGTAANRSPVVANAISPATIIVGGAPFTRDLNAAPVVFTDPDGDALTYTASSSVANVATAGIAGSTLTVSPVAAGSATITTTASDGKGGLVSINFNVSVRANQPPVINHTASVLVQAGRDISIVANITDDIGVASALLWYRKGGDRNFLNASMSKNGDFFTGIIPGADVTSRGVEYYIQTIDVGQISTRLPAGLGIFPIQVIIPEPGVMKSSAQPGGSAQTAYRLISVPLDLDDKNPRTILENNLGSYKDSKWRFSELRADQTSAEFPNTVPMNPGKAFWLIVRDPGKTIKTGAGKSNTTAGKFSIPLHPQWNFIGNPFHFTLPLQNLRLKSGRAIDINFYDGAWKTPASFQPFEGYAVYNGPPFSVDTLFIEPNPSGSTSNAEGKEILWSIRILAQCQQARDVDNVAAIVATASLSWDEEDRAEPPVIGEYVSVYFSHPEWGMLNQSYRADSRPEPTSGEVWQFEVITNIRDKVNLSFEGINSVPPEFEVWLVDEALQISQNLRKENGYAITGSGPEHPKRLKLVTGKRNFVGEQLAKVQAIPATYELSQNFPNPFNPATTIRYGLPREERVTLKIYNLLGEEIATLINDELKAAGYHVIVWDGRNQARQPVAGGVYFYHFQAGNNSVIRKAALVR